MESTFTPVFNCSGKISTKAACTVSGGLESHTVRRRTAYHAGILSIFVLFPPSCIQASVNHELTLSFHRPRPPQKKITFSSLPHGMANKSLHPAESVEQQKLRKTPSAGLCTGQFFS